MQQGTKLKPRRFKVNDIKEKPKPKIIIKKVGDRQIELKGYANYSFLLHFGGWTKPKEQVHKEMEQAKLEENIKYKRKRRG